MINLEESYYTVTKVTEGYDYDHGACKLYAFEHGDAVFEVGIYDDKVISILEIVDLEQYKQSRGEK
jgi:hypothetical protein